MSENTKNDDARTSIKEQREAIKRRRLTLDIREAGLDVLMQQLDTNTEAGWNRFWDVQRIMQYVTVDLNFNPTINLNDIKKQDAEVKQLLLQDEAFQALVNNCIIEGIGKELDIKRK